MTDEIPYDIELALSVPNEKGLLFVGTDNLDMLKNNMDNYITLEVIFFPYIEENGIYAPAGKPRRYLHAGKVISGSWNEANTKGTFRFFDGTVVYYDRSFVD